MPKPDTTPTVKNLDRRLANIEQILPTLITKDDLRVAMAPLATRAEVQVAIAAAVAPLATREEMHVAIAAAVAPLATRDEVRAEAVETRRHFDVVFESMRAEIRVFADGQVGLTERLDSFESKTERSITNLDRRVLRLEADRRR
jgi:hypothetical protein